MILAGFFGFCLWLTVSAGHLSAQTATNLISTGEDHLSYPEALLRQKDDYRAITEALRLQFESPNDAKRYDLNRLLYSRYLRSGDYGRADAIADTLLGVDASTETDPIRRKIAACQVWSLTERENAAAAERTWERYLHDVTVDPYPSIDSIPGVIDPEKARRYAMIVPGSGFLLSRQYGKAAVSFFLNALFIAGSYHYFSHQQYATAGLLLFFEIGWYRGGINASGEAAMAANRQTTRQYRRRWYDANLNCVF